MKICPCNIYIFLKKEKKKYQLFKLIVTQKEYNSYNLCFGSTIILFLPPYTQSSFIKVLCNGYTFHGHITFITKTCPCNVYPLEPQFYIEKLGFEGVYLFFLIFDPKHTLWVLVRTASTRRYNLCFEQK